jgi:putative ABC transport system ATP-binding protein
MAYQRLRGEVPAITFTEVNKVFATSAEDVWAVRAADFSISPGEFVALMGPSGCGKSTLINLAAGLELPTSGEVEIDGELMSRPHEALRTKLRLARVGVVFQDHNLLPELSALENVELPLRLRGYAREVARAEARSALEMVGLEQLIDRRPHRLSGGERQRVGIARAVAGQKRVLLADEATGALDATNSDMVFEIFTSLASEGYAVLCATHDPTVAKYCTRLLAMRDGVVTERDPAEIVTWVG